LKSFELLQDEWSWAEVLPEDRILTSARLEEFFENFSESCKSTTSSSGEFLRKMTQCWPNLRNLSLAYCNSIEMIPRPLEQPQLEDLVFLLNKCPKLYNLWMEFSFWASECIVDEFCTTITSRGNGSGGFDLNAKASISSHPTMIAASLAACRSSVKLTTNWNSPTSTRESTPTTDNGNDIRTRHSDRW